MKNEDFSPLYQAACKASDRDTYIQEALKTYDGPGGAELMGNIWDIAHLTVKDIRAKAGLTQPELANRFCIPLRTVQNWEQRECCPDYVVMMMADALELTDLAKAAPKVDLREEIGKRHGLAPLYISTAINQEMTDKIIDQAQAAWDEGYSFGVNALLNIPRDPADNEQEMELACQQASDAICAIIENDWLRKLPLELVEQMAQALQAFGAGCGGAMISTDYMTINPSTMVSDWKALHRED